MGYLASPTVAYVCGGSTAPQVHDCFADGHQKCDACPGNGKTCGGLFPVDCVSTAGNAGCEASPDAPGTSACANDDNGQCCYVLPPPAPAPATSGKSCDQPFSVYFTCDPSNSQYDPEDCCLVSCCAGKPVSAATRIADHIHCECAAQTESLLSTGAGVTTNMWNSLSAVSSAANVSANPCGGSFPVSCWSSAGYCVCESSPDAIDNACA